MADQVILGRCEDVMRGLPDNSVDAIVTAGSLAPYSFWLFLGYNKRTGQCFQHPRYGNLESVGHMNTIRHPITRECPVCGKEYQADKARLKHGRQTTCSRQCSYSLRSSQKTAERTSHICPVCLSEFDRLLSQKKDSQAIYCSRHCAYKGRALGITKRTVTSPYQIVKSQEKPVFVPCLHCHREIRTIPSLEDRKKFCSKRCQFSYWKTSMKGDSNPAWVDGRSYSKRCHRGHDWDKQRLAVYKRDNYTCQSCGTHCIGRKGMNKSNSHQLIQCHHIVFWSVTEDNSLENLVTLCASCHAKVHSGNLDVNEPT